MMNYANYDFYKKEYLGSLSNDLFSSFVIKASREIDKNINCKLTQKRILMLSDDDKYKLKYTTCELVDYFYLNGSNSSDGKANSISIDGVSIERNAKSEEKIKNGEKSIINNLPDELTRYL